MVITWKGVQVAVEANGPSHYTTTQPHRLLGNKALRERLLKRCGWVGVGGRVGGTYGVDVFKALTCHGWHMTYRMWSPCSHQSSVMTHELSVISHQ